MKSEIEIQRAHDLLVGILAGDVPWRPMAEEQETLKIMAAQADVICWVLNHDHNKSFEENMG